MRRRFFVLVTVVMVLVGMFPINSHAMERRPINDVILSENPDVPLSERGTSYRFTEGKCTEERESGGMGLSPP